MSLREASTVSCRRNHVRYRSDEFPLIDNHHVRTVLQALGVKAFLSALN
jgi:hypothetical protein